MTNLKFPNIIPSSEDWGKMRDLETLRDSVCATKACPVLYKERWKLQTWWVRFHKVSEPYVRENGENFKVATYYVNVITFHDEERRSNV